MECLFRWSAPDGLTRPRLDWPYPRVTFGEVPHFTALGDGVCMKDNSKSKAQLISELEQLRKRLRGFERAADSRNPVDASSEARYAERSPRDSGSRYQNMIEVAQEGIWIVDAEATTTFVNDKLARMLGYTIDEMMGRSVFDFVNEEDWRETRQHLERGKQGLKEQRDFQFRRKDGSSVWTMISTTPLFDDAGTFTGGLAMLMDVSDRKRAELTLRESEAKFRALAETTSAAIFIYRGLDLLYVNATTEAHTGYSREELLKKSLAEVVHPEFRELVKERALARQRGEPVPDRYEFKILTKTGETRWVDATSSSVEYGGQPAVIGTAFDITDRKRAEEALGESEAKFRVLAQTAASVILIYQDSKLVYVNPFSAVMSGYSVEEQLSMDFWDIMHPDSRELVKERGLARLRGETPPSRYEFRILTKSGETRWLDFSASNVEFQGKPSVLGTALDITERKRAEQALHKSQSRLQHVLSISPAIVYSLRIEGDKFVPEWVSESITRLTGYTITEALDVAWWKNHLHPDDRARVKAELPRLFINDRVVLEYRFQHKDAGFHWIHDEMLLVRDDSGKAVEVVGSWADVTERREAERALRENEERYRDLVENARDIIYTHDLNGNYTSVNKAVEQITGYTREEALKLNFTQSIAPEYLATVRQMIAAKLETQRKTIYDLEIIAKDRHRVAVEVNTRLVLQDGVPIGVTGIARDVTARKRVEEALRESQAQLQAILDNCPSMIFQKDLEGRYLQVNREFERTFNLSAAQVFGRTDAELFPPDIAAAFLSTDRNVLEAGRSLEFEETAHYAGGPHTYIVHKFPLQDSTGRVYAVGGISTDITARKVAEDELRKQKEILQKIIDHIPVMIRFRDKDGRIRLVNQEWQRTLGWTLEELQQSDLDILADSYPDPDYRQHVLDFIATASGEWSDFKTRTRDGQVIDTTWANVRLEDGTNIGIGRDITERKRAEEALLAAQARTESVLASVADTHVLFDWEWRYIYVNKAAVDAIGRPHEQILACTLWELYPDIVGTEIDRQYRRAMAERTPVAFDFHYETNDTWWHNRFYPVPEGLAVFATDITDRRRAEDALIKQKEVLQLIFDHAPLMITFSGADGRLKLVNREWARTLGWSLEEIRKDRVDIFAECYPDPQYREDVLKFVKKSNGVWADFKPRVRSGRVIDTSWIRVRLSDGTSIGIAQDITERKRAEERLRRQTAQLAALHEIGLEISAESELARVLEVVTRRACESQSATHCSVYTFDREGSELAITASLDKQFIGVRLKQGEGLASRVVATGEAQIVDNYSAWEGRARFLENTPLGPALAAPLKWQHVVIGAISLAREPGDEPFTAEDADFLEQIAAESAIAIHQATLFENLQETHKRLQVLAHRLIDAQEAERKRLARELHDRIGQALTAVQINLQSMQSGPDGAYRLEESLAIVEDALREAQDLSLELRPSLLDDLGLVAALRWYVDRFAMRANLLRCFNADSLDNRLAPEIETACFRIAQEALTNVVRHAQASTVWIQVKTNDSDLQLMIRDDGRGFVPREVISRSGSNMSLGLHGMQERASALGGLVEISASPGQGTEVRASFPLKHSIPLFTAIDET